LCRRADIEEGLGWQVHIIVQYPITGILHSVGMTVSTSGYFATHKSAGKDSKFPEACIADNSLQQQVAPADRRAAT
jgi:hypothetical protein